MDAIWLESNAYMICLHVPDCHVRPWNVVYTVRDSPVQPHLIVVVRIKWLEFERGHRATLQRALPKDLSWFQARPFGDLRRTHLPDHARGVCRGRIQKPFCTRTGRIFSCTGGRTCAYVALGRPQTGTCILLYRRVYRFLLYRSMAGVRLRALPP